MLTYAEHTVLARDLIGIHSRMSFIAGEILQHYRRFSRYGGSWVRAMNAINTIVNDLDRQWAGDGDREPYDWANAPIGAEPLTYVERLYKRRADVLPAEDHAKLAIELEAIADHLKHRIRWLQAKGYRGRLDVPMAELIAAMQKEAENVSARGHYLVEPSL